MRSANENGTQKEVTDIQQSEEVDEYGNHFVLASNGSSEFGIVDAESGLKHAPIKLSMGENTIDENGNNHGYGLLHIEAQRGEDIRNAGYSSVQEFVESVARNYTDIREGGIIANNQTYLLELVDEHNNTLFIQLSKNGEYWTINSAGIFRKKYSRNKREIYNRPALSPDTNTDTSGVDSGRTDGVTTPAGNSPQTSTDKDTDISETPQSLNEKVAEAEAETETTPTEEQAAVPSEAEQKRAAILSKVKEWEEKTGVKVEVVERPSQVRNKAVRAAIAAGETVKGWYGNKTKKVFIYLPNMESVDDVTETFVHEVVAHKGLNALLGEKAYNDLCLRVYEDMLTDEQRAQWLDYVGYVPTDAEGKRVLPTQAQKAAAADEYIASLAERTDVEAESLFGKFVDMVREFLAKQGFGLKMSDDALQSLLRQSYRNLHGKAVESASSEAVTDERASLRLSSSNKSAMQYDNANGTSVKGFFDFLRNGNVFEEGKPKVFHIANAGELLEKYGIKGKFMVGQFTFSKGHTQDEDHNLGMKEWVDVINNLNTPLAITSYKGLPNEYRIYTYATINGKNICVGVNVSTQNGEIHLSNIISAYGRDINKLLGKEGINLLYPDIKELKRKISQVSTGPNSPLNATSTASVSEVTDNSANEQGEEAVSLSKKKKSLVGLHNISEDKLEKAIKQGGLANPSFAVVDIDVQGHEGYGDITLVMPSSLVDGTDVYTGDAWSPTYPPISLRVDESGWGVIDKRLGEIEDDTLRRFIRSSVRNYLDDGGNARLEYVFLKEKGHEAPIEYKAAKGMIGIRGLEVDLGVSDLLQGETSYEAYLAAKPAAKRSFNMWRLVNGNAAERKKLIAQIRENRSLNEELGLTEDLAFGDFDLFVQQIKAAQDAEGSVDEFGTTRVASEKVDTLGLREEYEAWLSELMEDASAEEVFFSGFDRDGNRKYLPNTLENVSRHMRTQGMVNAYDNGGLSATRSHLLKRMNTLAAIRKNKDLLKGREKYDEVFKEMEHKLFMVISQLADMQEISSNKFMNIDYAEARLQEAITKRNPISYLNSEYGYQIAKDGEFAQSLDEFIQEVKSMPSKYFEGKFERPVYLNEFAGAVVPKGTRKEIVDALEGSGLAVMEYERGDENSRSKAIEELADEVDEQVMFSRVYHGSGASFDKFDHAFMGTGEGNQAFGWGTYVSEVEGVARMYAETEGRTPLYRGMTQRETWGANLENADTVHHVMTFMIGGRSFEEAANMVAERAREIGDTKLENDVNELSPQDFTNKSRQLYTVEIPDDNGSNYLYWEEVTSSEAIDVIIDELQAKYGEDIALQANLKYGQSGQHLYLKLERTLGSDKAASEFLNSIGYVGIKYPTNTLSGGHKDDSSNYVIFNEADLEIEERVSFSKRFGGNSGYVGYSMSKRAVQAREEGRFPKTDFKKEYGVSAKAFDALVDAGIISDGEWHHTSMYGNKTTFYSWEEDGFADFYAEHKKEIDAAAKGLNADGSSFVEDVPVNPYEEMKYSIPAGYYEFRRQVEQSGLSSELVDAAVDGKFPEVAKASENNRLFHEAEAAINAAKRRNKKAISERLNEIFEDVNFSKDGASQAEIEAVNEQFNKELQQQIDGTLPTGHIYQLGMPNNILKACDFPNLPIEMSSTNLAEHARKTRHTFELKDVRDLVESLQHPIAVFAYGDRNKSQNVIVEIQKDSRNFLVGVHFNQSKRGIVVSDIRGIFPKDNAEWLNWISQGKGIYLNKEKIQDLIDKQRKTLAEVEYLDLDDVANILESFENKQISEEENSAEQEDLTNITDEQVSFKRVTDPKKIAELDAEEKVTAYRSVQIKEDGKMFSPMASRLKSTKKVRSWKRMRQPK